MSQSQTLTPELLRSHVRQISMHPTSAPVETIASWYTILFGKFPSVRQLHYNRANLNEDIDCNTYLISHLPDGFTILSAQGSEWYEQNDDDSIMDCVYYPHGMINSQHQSETWSLVNEEAHVIVNILPDILIAAFDITDAASSGMVDKVMKIFRDDCLHKARLSKRIQYITRGHFGDFSLTPMDIRQEDKFNLQEYYNDDFAPIADNINRFVNSKDSGLVILHGEQGTGKTSFIRHLINTNECQFVYLPMDMATQLTNPDLVTFLQGKLSNSVIIIEDCEQLLVDRKDSPFNVGISNILNMADGILGDSLKMHIICTFNCDMQRIDKALLRKGRLVDMYEFRRLEASKTQSLLKSLYGDKAPEEVQPMTLAEIFNYNKENHAHYKERNKIGF